MTRKSVKAIKKPSDIKARADLILTRLKHLNPDPKCELYHETPYQLLVSVVLSAQATDKSVNAAVTDLYKSGFTVDSMLQMGELRFLQTIRSIGLAPTKAKNVYKLTQILKQRFNSDVPDDREALESLPGVGRKTANVILGEIFKQPTLAVDTHVFRVGARLQLHREESPENAEHALLRSIDPSWLPMAHHLLILHGRYICTARSPKCNECVLSDICEAKSIP
jgi:endonuclease III